MSLLQQLYFKNILFYSLGFGQFDDDGYPIEQDDSQEESEEEIDDYDEVDDFSDDAHNDQGWE